MGEMESKISKNKKRWEIKSKNYYARVKVMKSEKDGEYYDVVFGPRRDNSREKRLHYGIKVVAEKQIIDGEEKNIIGGKVFFTESRAAVSSHRQETINQETGEIISNEETIFDDSNEIVGAQLHYGVGYDKKKKKAFLRKFEIVEK